MPEYNVILYNNKIDVVSQYTASIKTIFYEKNNYIRIRS